MRLSWGVEYYGYVLRKQGYIIALVTCRPSDGGYFGVLLKEGLPDAGPYKNRLDAAAFVENIVRLRVDPDATFSDFPPWQKLEGAVPETIAGVAA